MRTGQPGFSDQTVLQIYDAFNFDSVNPEEGVTVPQISNTMEVSRYRLRPGETRSAVSPLFTGQIVNWQRPLRKIPLNRSYSNLTIRHGHPQSSEQAPALDYRYLRADHSNDNHGNDDFDTMCFLPDFNDGEPIDRVIFLEIEGALQYVVNIGGKGVIFSQQWHRGENMTLQSLTVYVNQDEWHPQSGEPSEADLIKYAKNFGFTPDRLSVYSCMSRTHALGWTGFSGFLRLCLTEKVYLGHGPHIDTPNRFEIIYDKQSRRIAVSQSRLSHEPTCFSDELKKIMRGKMME